MSDINIPAPNTLWAKHCIRVDADKNIISGWSDRMSPGRVPADDDIFLHMGMTQFRLTPDGPENPPLTASAIGKVGTVYLYRYPDGKVCKKTEEEIEAETRALPDTPAPGPTNDDMWRALLGE
jgi:hypothetical protein